ncbi:MAG: tetratricopeptide repeat protein, partial [Deltaproteobacteria bacterium]|nr:tetratricopeptide repeat protein [Deltaproteobacteria bacterium]
MFRFCTAGAIPCAVLAIIVACASLSPTPELYHEANEKTEAARYYLSRQQYEKAGAVAEQAIAGLQRLQSEGSRSVRPWLLEEKIKECREIVRSCRNPTTRRIRKEIHRAWDDFYLNGEYRKARAVYEHSLRVIEEQLGPDHRLLAECAGSLGNVYNAVGAYDRAEALYRRALEIREKSEEERKQGGLASSLHDL